MTFSDLLAALTDEFGLPPVDGSAPLPSEYSLLIDDMALRLLSTGSGVELIASIDTLHIQVREHPRFMLHLLASNLPDDDAGRPIAALDTDRRVVLSRHITLEGLSFPQFMLVLGRFVDHLEECHRQMAALVRPALPPLDSTLVTSRI